MNIAAASAALVTLVGAADAPIDPPACYVFSSGTDWTGLGGSSVEWQFRVTCAVGYPGSDGQATTALSTLLGTKLALLQASPLFRIVSVGGDATREIAGGTQLTADIAVTVKVDI